MSVSSLKTSQPGGGKATEKPPAAKIALCGPSGEILAVTATLSMGNLAPWIDLRCVKKSSPQVNELPFPPPLSVNKVKGKSGTGDNGENRDSGLALCFLRLLL